jgi:hypothetical protein
MKITLILIASLFVTYNIVCSEGENQQAWFIAGGILMAIFGSL